MQDTSQQKTQKIEISLSDAETMPVWLDEPSAPGRGLVILCHGFMSSKASRTNQTLTEKLVARGISACRFDFFGHGDDKRPFEEITLTACIRQIAAVVDWAASQNRHKRIGLMGSSFGGLAALLAASRRPEIDRIGLKCPVSDYPPIWRTRLGEAGMADWRARGRLAFLTPEGRARLRYTFFDDLLRHDAYRAAADIGAPVLIVHGDADTDVPAAQSRRLHAALTTRKRLQILSGADHAFSKPEDFDRMIGLLFNWFAEGWADG